LLESRPGVIFGSSPELKFVSPPSLVGPSGRVESLVRFDSSGVRGRGCEATQATLRLRTGDECDFAASDERRYLGRMTVSLAGSVPLGVGEDDVSWTNAPPNREGIPAAQLSLGNLQSNEWAEVDVTDLVHSSTTSDIAFRISSILFAAGLSSCTLASKEFEGGRYAPQLIMEFRTGPADDQASDQAAEQAVAMATGSPSEPSLPSLPECATPYEARRYQGGETASRDGKNYECKSYPYNGWCGARTYEPGGEGWWEVAWTLLEECRLSPHAALAEEINQECASPYESGRLNQAGELVAADYRWKPVSVLPEIITSSGAGRMGIVP
ncbi:hypothetical protein ACHAWF_004605, partial [Thalassiosira exigua]